jgi:hypothetical protein
VFINIANGKSTRGSAEFTNSGNTQQRDCYYSIHKFNYTKTSSTSRTVTITDVYDFAYGADYHSFLAQAAINTMMLAQQEGVITPYNVKITVEL